MNDEWLTDEEGALVSGRYRLLEPQNMAETRAPHLARNANPDLDVTRTKVEDPLYYDSPQPKRMR
jgi:hypothetical protein